MRDRLAGLRRASLSIRGRTAGVAVALVGTTLLIGAVALVLLLRVSLTESVRLDLEVRGEEIAMQIDAGTPLEQLRLPITDDLLIQVLDGSDNVIARGSEAPLRPLAVGLHDGETATVTVDDDEVLVLAARIEGSGVARTVLVSRGMDLVRESTEVVSLLLAIGLPLLLLLVGVVAWKLVGRSLAPVEAIRTEVDAISEVELHRRVPVPGGGDELARLAHTMNAMLDRLEEARTRQQQLVADTSHELRSPITTIRQRAEVALAHPDPDAAEELAETVLAESMRLARMVDDLLLLARADERTLELISGPVDLDDLVFDAAKALHSSRPMRVNVSRVSAGRVRGDAGTLRRVVANLVENAARHANRTVALSVSEVGDEVILEVDDDGQGIPEADRQRVFERFVRLDAARARDSGGSGLGLAIVSELVAAHHGRVAIAQSPLGGARVEVRLPRTDD
ncbi:MAG: ATP-binding protein [Candidatus Limnocylindria bacterium]